MERLIGFDVQFLAESGYAGLAVLFLFFVLSYLLFNPMKDVLEKRKQRIATDLEEARTGKESVTQLKAEYESRLASVENEVAEILENARKKAKLREEEIITEARAEATRITERANSEIELAKKKATDDMRKEIIGVASLLAMKAIGSHMNIDIHSQLVDDTLKEIGVGTWES